ncbi:DinB family protein [bacterium]|nr:DinB family protein [bacterium]
MKQPLLAAVEKTRQYTLNVGEAMPSEKYNFKPDSAVWTYGELMHHIAYGIVWMEENYLRKTKSEWNPPKTTGKKEEVMSYLKQSLEILHRSVSSAGEINEDFVNSFYSIIEHTAHHRGQATTYLRCCKIVPPEYPF